MDVVSEDEMAKVGSVVDGSPELHVAVETVYRTACRLEARRLVGVASVAHVGYLPGP